MKEKFIENGIEYVKNGDYYIPNLTVPDDKVYHIGKYGRLHSIFIKENRPCLYSMKMLDGTWLAYLEEKARAIISDVISQYTNGEIDYTKAEFNARVKIYQSVNPTFNPDEEFAKDTCYRDIPSVDNSLFIIARKLILEAKK